MSFRKRSKSGDESWGPGGLWVILNAEERFAVTDAFDGLIVQIGFVDLNRRIHRLIQGKPMVLGGDFHQAGIQILDRLVGPSVSKFHFKGAGPNA